MAVTPCPIPLPPGSDGGTFFGPNQPLPFPDRTLAELFGDDRLDGEIIVVLQNTKCLNGMPFDTLLDNLQSRFPGSFWTQSLLQSRLTEGRRRGRFCLAGNNTWVLRSDMVNVNYNNQKFQGLTKNIDRVPITQTTVVSVHDAAYKGNLPVCGSGICGVPQLTNLIPPQVLRNLRNRFGQSQGF